MRVNRSRKMKRHRTRKNFAARKMPRHRMRRYTKKRRLRKGGKKK